MTWGPACFAGSFFWGAALSYGVMCFLKRRFVHLRVNAGVLRYAQNDPRLAGWKGFIPTHAHEAAHGWGTRTFEAMKRCR